MNETSVLRVPFPPLMVNHPTPRGCGGGLEGRGQAGACPHPDRNPQRRTWKALTSPTSSQSPRIQREHPAHGAQLFLLAGLAHRRASPCNLDKHTPQRSHRRATSSSSTQTPRFDTITFDGGLAWYSIIVRSEPCADLHSLQFYARVSDARFQF